METESRWENDCSISIVKTEIEDFVSTEYEDVGTNEQSDFHDYGNVPVSSETPTQHGNGSLHEVFQFKQEGIDTGEDMEYRMECYQNEEFHPQHYPDEEAANMGDLGEWNYENGYVSANGNPETLDQPGTSDMSIFADEKREEKLYPCRHCDYVGNHPRLLDSHMNNRHTKSVIYQCPHCPYNSTISRSTKDHVATKHDNEDDKPIEIKRKCPFCDYSIGNATVLKNHMNKHTKEKQHQCPFCEFNTLWDGYLKMHIRRKHSEQTINSKTPLKEYACQYCDYKAITPSTLKLHTNKHTREQEHQCPYCPYKTVWTTYIKSHIQNKHFKPEKAAVSKEHACNFCDYKAKNSTLLKQHLNKHTREKIHQCPHCPFSTLWLTYMKLHIKRKHTVKPEGEAEEPGKREFQCQYCSYKAISSSHLKIHENKHTKAVEYKCEQCDFKTTWYGYLKLHTKRKHSVKEENPTVKLTYPCNFCPYKAINPSTLKVHQNKHTREVLYDCPHCEFKTTWRAYIKMHIAKHNVEKFKTKNQSGIRAFPCEYCDYKATQMGALKLHINSIHTRQVLHKCPHCEYECAVLGNLKMHIRRRHGVKPDPDGKYRCQDCEFTSENSDEFKTHLNETHDKKIEVDDIKRENQKIYSCQHCSYQTFYPQVMKKHVNKHTRQNVIQCPHCEYATVWGHYMKVHIRKHNEPKNGRQRFTRPNTDQSRLFPCQFCDHRSLSFSSLKDHINSVHTRSVLHKCPYCDHKCSLKGNLRGHIRRRHPAQFVESEKRYSCEKCDFKTSMSRFLRIHLKNEHEIEEVELKFENGEFKCEFCDYKAKSRFSLKIHTNKHTKERSFRCTECEFVTRWPNYLQKHIKQHKLNKRKVTCVYCDYQGCSTFRLRKHIETLHKRDQYYHCPKPKCEFKTIHYPSLRIHLKGNIHAGGRKKSHMSVTRNFSYKYEPNEGRYFACDYCEYASKTQGNLDLHVKNKHEKKVCWRCGLCSYKTPSKSYLTRHYKNKHMIKKEEPLDDEENENLMKREDDKTNSFEEEHSSINCEDAIENSPISPKMEEKESSENNSISFETKRSTRQRNSLPSYVEEQTDEEDSRSGDVKDFEKDQISSNVLEDNEIENHCGQVQNYEVNPAEPLVILEETGPEINLNKIVQEDEVIMIPNELQAQMFVNNEMEQLGVNVDQKHLMRNEICMKNNIHSKAETDEIVPILSQDSHIADSSLLTSSTTILRSTEEKQRNDSVIQKSSPVIRPRQRRIKHTQRRIPFKLINSKETKNTETVFNQNSTTPLAPLLPDVIEIVDESQPAFINIGNLEPQVINALVQSTMTITEIVPKIEINEKSNVGQSQEMCSNTQETMSNINFENIGVLPFSKEVDQTEIVAESTQASNETKVNEGGCENVQITTQTSEEKDFATKVINVNNEEQDQKITSENSEHNMLQSASIKKDPETSKQNESSAEVLLREMKIEIKLEPI